MKIDSQVVILHLVNFNLTSYLVLPSNGYFFSLKGGVIPPPLLSQSSLEIVCSQILNRFSIQ